jgi:Tfp pilus assembly protein PilW
MKNTINTKQQEGFTLMELMISLLILIPIMGAAISLFSVGANQQASEQNSIDTNQEARSALEMMTTEIAQAGSHGDCSTVTTGTVSANSTAQPLSVASVANLMVGDWVDVDTGASAELVEIKAVGDNSISAIFRAAHTTVGVPVRLFALPFTTGLIPPSGMTANSSTTVTTLRLFGDINSDSILQYVEYAYDSANNQITRSITPITQTTKNPALSLIRNVKPNSVQFTLNADSLGVVTSANIALTVQNTWGKDSQLQETALSTRVTIPSAAAGSVLLSELRNFGGVDQLPPTPARVTTWVNQ